MTKSAAVNARDSASTDAPASAQYDGAGDGYEQQDARQLEGEEIVLEQRRGNGADGIQLGQLLLIEITRYDQLLRQLRAQDDHDLAEKANPDQPRGELPAEPPRIRQLRRMPKI